MIGIEPKQLAPAAPADRLLPASLDLAAKASLTDNPAIHAAAEGMRVSVLQTEITRGELLPTLSATGLLTRRRDVLERGDEQVTGSIVGRVTIPLYEGGEVRARIRQSRHVTDQRTMEAEAVRDDVRALAITAWGQLEAAKERIKSAELGIAAARTALGGLQEEWRVGERTMREVLDAQQDLLSALVNRVVAQRDRVVATYFVAKAMGRLTLASLAGSSLAAAKDEVFTVKISPMKTGPLTAESKFRASAERNPCRERCVSDAWPLRGAIRSE